MSSRVTYAAAVAWAWLGSSAAEACPYCAGRDGGQAFGSIALLGLAILAPFAVAGVVGFAIRRVVIDDDGPIADDSRPVGRSREIAAQNGARDVRRESSPSVADAGISAENGRLGARDVRCGSSHAVALAEAALPDRPVDGRVADADRTNEAVVVEPSP